MMRSPNYPEIDTIYSQHKKILDVLEQIRKLDLVKTEIPLSPPDENIQDPVTAEREEKMKWNSGATLKASITIPFNRFRDIPGAFWKKLCGKK